LHHAHVRRPEHGVFCGRHLGITVFGTSCSLTIALEALGEQGVVELVMIRFCLPEELRMLMTA